jgi:hypothetical protein
MGKMLFEVTSEISVSPEYVNHAEFPKNTELEIKTNLSEFGEIEDFTSELREGNILKTRCVINVSPDLVKTFESWSRLELTRSMEGNLRLTLRGFGEVLYFGFRMDYEPDIKTFKNPFRSLLFFFNNR